MRRKNVKIGGEDHKLKTSFRIPEPDFLPEVKYNKWKPEFIRYAYFFSLMGYTDVQMAQALNVSDASVEKWKRVIPEFLQAIHEGKALADAKVAHSLYQAAIGYEHEEEVIIANKIREYNDKGRPIKEWTTPLRVKTTRRYPPNVQAGIRWLASRQPEVWGNKMHVDGTINHKHELDLSKFSIQELEVLNKLGLKEGKNVEDIDYEEE